MSSSAAEQSLLRLTRAPIIREPFRHIYVRDVFPADFYGEMLRNLPSEEQYGEERGYPYRRLLHPPELGGFWNDLFQWMSSDDYITPLYHKFREVREERYPGVDLSVGKDIRLVRDDPGYYLSPHTDVQGKFLSFLFYLPSDERLRDFGTTIFKPHNPELTNNGRDWLKFEDFKPVWAAPFMPNTCFAFARTDKSFHGVIPNECGLVRDALLLNIIALPA